VKLPLPWGKDEAAPKAVPPAKAAAPANPAEPEPKPDESAELLAQRDRLLEKFTVMQADLGGAFYEMAIRDHVRMDVLTRKAAELQRVDSELLAIERVLELQREDAAGLCPSCGAPFAPGVRFCAQCGNPLVPVEALTAPAAPRSPQAPPAAESKPPEVPR
jgi:NADH pyrophosphatase NudC (nudix superfamily)